jgi:hypothetical protein
MKRVRKKIRIKNKEWWKQESRRPKKKLTKLKKKQKREYNDDYLRG